jgi:hypothetical protein
MSRSCKVCISEHVAAIDGLLFQGFGSPLDSSELSWRTESSCDRHKRADHHLKMLEGAKQDSTEDLNFAVEESKRLYNEAKDKQSATGENGSIGN